MEKPAYFRGKQNKTLPMPQMITSRHKSQSKTAFSKKSYPSLLRSLSCQSNKQSQPSNGEAQTFMVDEMGKPFIFKLKKSRKVIGEQAFIPFGLTELKASLDRMEKLRRQK